MAANLLITITCMLFEGGALLDSLSGKPQGQALAQKVEDADRSAMQAGQTDFELTMDPIEVGMAINALTKGQSDLGRSLGEKLEQALAAKLQELGIQYGSGGGGGLGDVQSFSDNAQDSTLADVLPSYEQMDADAQPSEDAGN